MFHLDLIGYWNNVITATGKKEKKLESGNKYMKDLQSQRDFAPLTLQSSWLSFLPTKENDAVMELDKSKS